jgi:hypothetical protein
MLVLKLLLGCALLPLLAVAVVSVIKGPRYVRGIWNLIMLAGKGATVTPSRITLEEAKGDVWNDRRKVQQFCRELQQEGFVPLGVWVPRELSAFVLAGLLDERRRLYGVVYDIPLAGVWVDLFCLHEDGSGLTVTNKPMGWGIEQPSDREKSGRAKATVAELLALADDHWNASARIELDEDSFVRVFEQEYAREMDWRLARGGVTAAEVAKTAEEMGVRTSEADVQEVLRRTQEQNLPEIGRACVANFLHGEELNAEERRALEPRMLAIHDRMTREQAVDLFEALVGEDFGDVEEHSDYVAIEAEWEDLTPREIFSRLAAVLERPSFPVFVGTVEMPVEADVYVMRVLKQSEG